MQRLKQALIYAFPSLRYIFVMGILVMYGMLMGFAVNQELFPLNPYLLSLIFSLILTLPFHIRYKKPWGWRWLVLLSQNLKISNIYIVPITVIIIAVSTPILNFTISRSWWDAFFDACFIGQFFLWFMLYPYILESLNPEETT